MDRVGLLWDARINEAVRDGVGPAAPVFEVVTHLGDGTFLLVLGILIYWFGARDVRRDRAFVIAIGIAALALSVGLKGVVQLTRPELGFAPAGYPGYSFPSAHAMGSAAFYGALAVTMTRGRRAWRYALVVVLVGTIALSRIVLGVHYLGDVLVGSLLGFLLVGVGVWSREAESFNPGPVFILAMGIAMIGALAGSVAFLSLTLGASVGGTVGWYAVRDRETTTSGAAVLVLGVAALVTIGLLRLVSMLLAPSELTIAHHWVVTVGEMIGYGMVTAFVLVIPTLATHIEQSPVVLYLQRTLPFRGRIVDP